MDSKSLQDILENCRSVASEGKVAEYIPELKKSNPESLGFCITDLKGNEYKLGDFDAKFTIQSISKIVILNCCLLDNDISKIKEKISFEPTADPFNSIKELEMKNSHRPLNPMINSGAIACVSLVKGTSYDEKFERILNMVRKLAANENITYNLSVYESEKATGFRNRALAYYMKSTNIIDNDIGVEELLDVYFKICSIEIDCIDLSRIALVYANGGYSPITKERYFSKKIGRIVTATMALCGMYDESGDVAVTVGLPSKSGVGGGVLSVVPNQMGIGIYGPSLNSKGTSIAGLKVLEMISSEYDLSIY